MTIKQLTNIVEEATVLRGISVAYTEIASNKLKRIRTLVEKNRAFLDDLSIVYKIVKQIAQKKNALPLKNGRTICIVITSNYHFYGNVNQKLISYFVENMRGNQCDQIIIGKTALEWLKEIQYNLPFAPLILQKDYPTNVELDLLVAKIKDYSQILIFYSRLQTVMVQIPTYKDITQTSYLQNQPSPTESRRPFIFEPEMTKILDFFEKQVMNLLLQQTFLDSELSRTASRLVSMDQAQLNADKYIHEQALLLNQAKRSIINSRLLETYTSLIVDEEKKKELYG